MLAADVLSSPLAQIRSRISESIDRHLANAAGTINGLPMRGCYRRTWAEQDVQWAQSAGGTRCTLMIDADLIQTGFAGQAQAAAGQSWYDGTAPLSLVDPSGQILRDSAGVPLSSSVTVAIGWTVEITDGEGIGLYTIAEAHPSDGGRVMLILTLDAA